MMTLQGFINGKNWRVNTPRKKKETRKKKKRKKRKKRKKKKKEILLAMMVAKIVKEKPLYGAEYKGNKNKKETNIIHSEPCAKRVPLLVAAGFVVTSGHTPQ